AGASIERARIAGRWPAAFRAGKSENDDVPINCGRGSWTVIYAVELCVHAFAQVHGAGVAECGVGAPGGSVERDKPAVGHAEKNARLFAVTPIRHTTIHT